MFRPRTKLLLVSVWSATCGTALRTALLASLCGASSSFVVTPARAAAPVAVIVGEDTVQPGDMTKLDGSKSQGKAFAWASTMDNKRWVTFPDGKTAFFATSTPGRYTFFLFAVDLEGTQVLIEKAEHTVVVGQPDPGPNPEPGPGPAPLPPGRYELAAKSLAWASLVTLPSADKQAAAQRLASSIEAMAAKFAATKNTTNFRDIWPQVKAANQLALGAQHAAWIAWGQQWDDYVTGLNKAGRMVNVQDAIDALTETATGLRVVR